LSIKVWKSRTLYYKKVSGFSKKNWMVQLCISHMLGIRFMSRGRVILIGMMEWTKETIVCVNPSAQGYGHIIPQCIRSVLVSTKFLRNESLLHTAQLYLGGLKSPYWTFNKLTLREHNKYYYKKIPSYFLSNWRWVKWFDLAAVIHTLWVFQQQLVYNLCWQLWATKAIIIYRMT